jgi:hypothetical protein
MMADIEVLAEDTAEIASGEKYRPRPALPDKDAFLAEVRPDGADYRLIADSAKADFAFTPADFALSWTKHTRTDKIPQFQNRFTKRHVCCLILLRLGPCCSAAC